MKNLVRVVALLVLTSVLAPAARSQSDLGRSRYQGVSWPDGEGVPRVVSEAVSTGTFFSQSFYRTTDFYTRIESDRLEFFFRVAQTVNPLGPDVPISRVEEIIVNDAKGLAKKLGTAEADIKVHDCTRLLCGEMRTGKAVSGIVLPGASGPQSVTGFYECYAFEHEGRGIGVIVKITVSDPVAKARDAAQAEAILRWMTPHVVDAHETYRLDFFDGRFTLPVASTISDVQTPQGYALASVQMNGAWARIVCAQTGATQDADEAFEFVLAQLQSETDKAMVGNESIEVLSDQTIRLATGHGDLSLIPSPIKVIKQAGEPQLSMILSRKEKVSTFAAARVLLQDPDHAGVLVRSLGSGMQGGRLRSFSSIETRLLPGISLRIDSLTGLNSEPRDGLYEIAPERFRTGHDRIDVVRSGRSFNAIGLAPEGESLMGMHNKFVMLYYERNNEREGKMLGSLANGTTTIEPNESLGFMREWVRTELACVSEGATLLDHVTISSTVVEFPDSKQRLVVHNVSPRLLRGVEMGFAEAIIAGATPLGEGEHHSIGIADLTGELGEELWFVTREDMTGTTTYSTMTNDCRVRVTVYDDDPRNSVLSSKYLADGHLRHRFEYMLMSDELDAFRAKPGDYAETTIAGQSALMIERTLIGKDQGGTGLRQETARVRGYGVSHGDAYTTVVIFQDKNLDTPRLDDVAGMFVAPAK